MSQGCRLSPTGVENKNYCLYQKLVSGKMGLGKSPGKKWPRKKWPREKMAEAKHALKLKGIQGAQPPEW